MFLPCDYHMHTPLCGHADGRPEEYAAAAIKRGLSEMGFSDHAPLIAHSLANVSMSREELPVYQEMIENVQKQYLGLIKIKCGLEADFVPGHESQTRQIINAYSYDYVIGSVHFIGDWCFDNPDEIESWKNHDVTDVYRDYYQLLCKCATSRLFNIIGHVDLVKKFGHRPDKDFSSELEAVALTFKESGVAVEINTSGLRKPVKEIYPDIKTLKIFANRKIPITFGSDAHRPEEVGKNFEQAVDLAFEAGYREYVQFKGRKISEVTCLSQK